MKKQAMIRLKLANGAERIFLHRGSRADLGVLQQVMKNNDYSLGRLKRGAELLSLYRKMVDSGRVPLIFDLGANMGASAVWFSIQYPNAHTVCVEPDKENFELLSTNTDGLNVDLFHAAIGANDGIVDLIDHGGGEWGYTTRLNPNGTIRMISLNKIISEKIAQGFQPFIAKIDIVGAEDDLFSDKTDWIDKFPLVIVELHDWLFPKKGTARNFLRVISDLDRDFVYIGENVFSIKN